MDRRHPERPNQQADQQAPVATERKRGQEVIGTTLASAERRLVALLAEQADNLRLTTTEDPVTDLGAVLAPVLDALRMAAGEVGAPTATRSLRRLAAATLSILWADLVELAPDRLAGAWGAEVPEGWAALHAELLAWVRWAADRVEGRAER
jgi:hypothetical protein